MEPQRSRAKDIFLHKYKSDYGYNGTIDAMRDQEFSRLKGTIYLDHAGAGLYSETQMKKTLDHYNSNVFGNPHSLHASGTKTSQEVEQIREMILSFFNTTSQHYSVIFTSGCTAALKLVAETFPWTSGSRFCYLIENHNSVLGMRECAIEKGASFEALNLDELLQLDNSSTSSDAYHLIALPAENNFSGVKIPLGVVNSLQLCAPKGQWKVLLDAAAYVSHSELDLSTCPADFVTVSFYKMFGFPTGVGALIVKNDTAKLLKKTYFGGGTVAATLSTERFHVLRSGISERFEDGTISFLNIISLKHGFEVLNRLGIQNIERHTHSLTQYLTNEMQSMVHYNGKKVCTLYGNHYFNDSSKQGPIITFNVLRPDGSFVGYHEVEQLATLNNIHLRTGCFCNPGSCNKYLNLSKEEVLDNLAAGKICWDDKDIIKGKPTGAVRVSLGYCSTFEDVQAFIDFMHTFFVHAEILDDLRGRKEVEMKEPLSAANSQLSLQAIYVYPVKSCGRFEVAEWEITSHGLLYDREWVLIDDNFNYLNQKKLPKLCLIRPTIDIENNCLCLDAPGMDTLTIPLSHTPREEIDLRVCGDNCIGYRYNKQVNQWFSTFLECRCSLVRNAPAKSTRTSGGRAGRSNARRESQQPQAEDQEESKCAISFSNESQFLIVSQSSVEEVNSRLPNGSIAKAVNFRPNFVISGGTPYQEDEWKTISIGDQLFKIAGACNRCKMICVDQETATEGKEPLLTLASYRRNKGRILFGVHAEHNSSLSSSPHIISCRSPVKAIEEKEQIRYQDVGNL